MVLRTPQPYDTTTLNYNWQIWDTQAFSLYTKETDCIDRTTARMAVEAVLRFLAEKGLSHGEVSVGEKSVLFRENTLESILTTAGGLFFRHTTPGDRVQAGSLLADILDPCTGRILEQLHANRPGRIFFAHKSQLIAGREAAFKILPL